MASIQIDTDESINFITGHAPAFQVFGKKPEDYDYVYKILEDYAEICIRSNRKSFIVGDYNTEKLFEMLPFIKKNFNNHIKGSTWIEGTSIDYIMSQKDIKCLSNEKIENLSDHLLCIAEFVLPFVDTELAKGEERNG